jgi:hypothetical protein
MSDGKVLSKLDVRFRSDARKHTYGWTVRGKAKAGLTPARFVEIYESQGFRRVAP